MKLNKSFILVFILVLGINIFAQDVSNRELGVKQAEFKKQAIEYLRDTASEINTLRTNENRISFSAELANLLWVHDEKEARQMFAGVTDNFVQLLNEYNSNLESLGGTRNEAEFYGSSPLFGGSQRSNAVRKLYRARDVRSQVALAIAEHDAQLAYDFVIRTGLVITDKDLAESYNEQNTSLESQILERMGTGNLERALAFGRRSLKRGFNQNLVTLAQKIYLKDPEAAIEFGKELVDKVRSEASSESKSLEDIFFILTAGSEVADEPVAGTNPLFDKQALQGLADLLANNLTRNEEFDSYYLERYIVEIEKYSASQASRVKSHFASKEDSASKKGDKFMAAGIPGIPTPGGISVEAEVGEIRTPEQIAESRRAEERNEFMQELQEFGSGEVSREQKSQFVAKARRIVREMNDPMMKVLALTTLAVHVKRLGDSELAADIMREGDALVNPNPQNFVDFILVWSLASGYAQVEPKESFSLIEDAIYRLNDTIAAAVKIAEFIDVPGEMVVDGEFQLGAFGGPVTRSFSSAATGSEIVLSSLSHADFERTKALADKFERPEVRVLARLLILRSVLPNSESAEMGLIK